MLSIASVFPDAIVFIIGCILYSTSASKDYSSGLVRSFGHNLVGRSGGVEVLNKVGHIIILIIFCVCGTVLLLVGGSDVLEVLNAVVTELRKDFGKKFLDACTKLSATMLHGYNTNTYSCFRPVR